MVRVDKVNMAAEGRVIVNLSKLLLSAHDTDISGVARNECEHIYYLGSSVDVLVAQAHQARPHSKTMPHALQRWSVNPTRAPDDGSRWTF